MGGSLPKQPHQGTEIVHLADPKQRASLHLATTSRDAHWADNGLDVARFKGSTDSLGLHTH